MYFFVFLTTLSLTILHVNVYANLKSEVIVGLNLSGIVDYASQWPFTNAFLASRPWTGEKTGVNGYYHQGLNIDENGWIKRLNPGEAAFALLFVDINKKYPEGKYLLTYEGEGRIQFKWNAFVSRQGKGYYVLDVLPDDTGIEVRIVETNPSNPLRNIRLLMPGYWEQNETYPFHPLFLERIKNFNIYRFMDWQETNNSINSSWAYRPKITDATFSSGKGVPLEYMILLCNLQKASPWFNMPHMADDEYVEKFATYVKKYLDSSLDIYVEYSNEVWNTMFKQHRYVANMGRNLGLSEEDFQAHARYYSHRSLEIYEIWKNVFNNESRVKLVLAGQMGNHGLAKEILEWKGAYRTANIYAVAPYFGGKFCYGEDKNKAKQMSLMDFERALKDDIQDVGRRIRQEATLAKGYGLPLAAYEAGQHLACHYGSENDELLNQLFDAINRDEAMKRLYLFYLGLWKKNDGGIMMIFSSIAKQSKWGRWGMTEDMYRGRGGSPKLDGILKFIESE